MVIFDDDSVPEWTEKCLKCVHCYLKKDDADTIYCRCRFGQCNYKERSSNEPKTEKFP